MRSRRAAARAGRQQPTWSATGRPAPPATRRDAVRNYQRILDAAREVLGESGAEASMEQIAARAGVGVGTVYRRFASKDALIDELLRLALADLLDAAEEARTRPDGRGLEDLLTAFGRSFSGHARYASLLLERPADPASSHRLRTAIDELTRRAAAGGAVSRDITADDVMALIWSMRGLVQAAGDVAPGTWQRFLDIHLAGMRTGRPLGDVPVARPRTARPQ
jgi:AcrR family transcriptional regulator